MQIGKTFICINTLICDRADFIRSIELKIFAENNFHKKISKLQYLCNECLVFPAIHFEFIALNLCKMLTFNQIKTIFQYFSIRLQKTQ